MKNGLKAACVMLAAIAWMTTAGGCMSAEDAAAFRDGLASELLKVEQARDDVSGLIADVRAAIVQTDDAEVLAGLNAQLEQLEQLADRYDGTAEQLSASIREVEDGPPEAVLIDIAKEAGATIGLPGMGALGVISLWMRNRWRNRLRTVVASVDHIVEAASDADRKAVAKKQGQTLTKIVKDMAAGVA